MYFDLINQFGRGGLETYLTVKEVAVLLKLSVQTIRRYTMNKEIPFHKVSRAVRYKKSEIEQWFEKRNGGALLNFSEPENRGNA